MNSLFISRVLTHSPSTAVTDAGVSVMDDLAEATSSGYRIQVPALGKAASDLYRGTRTPAGVAEFVARSAQDPVVVAKLLKERRVGVLVSLSGNPHLSLRDVAALFERASSLGLGRDVARGLEASVTRLLGTEELSDEFFTELVDLDPSLTGAVLAAHPLLSPSQLERLLALSSTTPRDPWLGVITKRPDLARFPSSTLSALADAMLASGTRYSLATHPDLLELGPDCFAATLEVDPQGAARRTDLPASAYAELVERALDDSSSARRSYRQDSLLEPLSANPSVDPEVFAQASPNASPQALGRLMAHRFGDDAALWETALRLASSMRDSSNDEVLQAAVALV